MRDGCEGGGGREFEYLTKKSNPKVACVEDMRFEPASARGILYLQSTQPSFDKEGFRGREFEYLTKKSNPKVACVEDMRFELTTSCMPCKRSNQLS